MATDFLVDDVSEMLIATQPYIQRDKPVFEVADLQEYHAVDRLYGAYKEEPGTGTSVEFPVVLEVSNRASGVDLTETFTAQFGHTSALANIPWRHSRSGYAYIRQLITMNSSSPERVYNYLTQERNAGWMSFYKYLETCFWGLTLAASTKDPWGVFNWIVYNATEGFNGGIPTGYSDVAGISHAKWKNYTGQYTDVTADDFMQMAWKMKLRTGFKTPEEISDDYAYSMDRRQYYVNLATLLATTTLAETRNENLGWDLSPTNKPLFGGNQLTWVPAFDGEYDFSATILSGSDPFLQVDWSRFGYVFLKGEFLREDKPIRLPDKPNTYGVPIELTSNTYCNCRRAQGLLAKSNPTA